MEEIEFTTWLSTWLCNAEMVADTLEMSFARPCREFSTAVELEEDDGACDATPNAAARLVRPVAMDWLSPGPPSRPLSWVKKLAAVSNCEADPLAERFSCCRKESTTR